MMNRRRRDNLGKIKGLNRDDGPDLTPMIDIVFLLLAFFMVTTDFTQEADLVVSLPPQNAPTPDEMSDEHTIAILPSGEVTLNQAVMDHIESRGMPQLFGALQQLKSSSESLEGKLIIIIEADKDSLHQRTVDVLNACRKANIKFISFSSRQ